jgi:hypothetical protein
MRSALPKYRVVYLGKVPTGRSCKRLFYCPYVIFVPSIYRVTGWHEGSVEESPQSTTLQRSDLGRERKEDIVAQSGGYLFLTVGSSPAGWG